MTLIWNGTSHHITNDTKTVTSNFGISSFLSLSNNDKCITDINNLVSENFRTGNFCFCSITLWWMILQDELKILQLLIDVTNRWHSLPNKPTKLQAWQTIPPQHTARFPLWHPYGIKIANRFDPKFCFVHHYICPSCWLQSSALIQIYSFAIISICSHPHGSNPRKLSEP